LQKTGPSHVPTLLQLIAENPFGFLAEIQKDLRIPSFTDKDAAYTAWWSQTQHHLLLKISVMISYFFDPSIENEAHMYSSQRKITEWLESESTPDEAKEAARKAIPELIVWSRSKVY